MMHKPLVPDSPKKGRPTGSSGDVTGPKILKVAMAVFGRRGYTATSMKDIAQAAELTVGSIYHYYPSKAELFIAAASELYTIFYNAFIEAIEPHADFVGRVHAMLDASERLHYSDEALPRFAMSLPVELRHHAELREALAPRYSRFTNLYAKITQEAADRNELLQGAGPRIIAIMLESMLSAGLPQMARMAGDGRLKDVVQTFKLLISRRVQP